MKTCPRCREQRSLSDFYGDPSKPLGVSGWCKECCRDHKSIVRGRQAETVTEKTCRDCKLTKPKTEFSRDATSKGGLYGRCKPCRRIAEAAPRMTKPRHRRDQLWNTYRMTVADLEAMVAAQNGLCAICQRPWRKPYVDHCHVTGRVRALLCCRCNNRLQAIEDRDYRIRAIAYLERFSAEDSGPGFKISEVAARNRKRWVEAELALSMA